MTKVDKILQRFEIKGLVKGYKTFKNSGLDFLLIEQELNRIVNDRIKQKRYGEVLSLIYQSGRLYNQNLVLILKKLFQNKDYTTFLKQAYRFDVYVGLKNEINYSIDWHIKEKKQDAFAWKEKFKTLAQNLQPTKISEEYKEKICEEESIEANKFVTLKIQPINKSETNSITKSTNKFVQIQYEKKKLDKANLSHLNTQKKLENLLIDFDIYPLETKHVDIYAEFNSKNFLFEIKSITQRNERSQTRSAISQLYEYAFLYGIENPVYFILFSSKPENKWIIQYLEKERNIGVLWINEKNKIDGTGFKELEKNCVQHSLKFIT